jgi:hypothetical protein
MEAPRKLTLRYFNTADATITVHLDELDLGELDPTDPADHADIAILALESDIDFPELGICCDGHRSGRYDLTLNDEYQPYRVELEGLKIWSEEPGEHSTISTDDRAMHSIVTAYQAMVGPSIEGQSIATTTLELLGADERAAARRILRGMLAHLDDGQEA